jgi:hypothetical protein
VLYCAWIEWSVFCFRYFKYHWIACFCAGIFLLAAGSASISIFFLAVSVDLSFPTRALLPGHVRWLLRPARPRSTAPPDCLLRQLVFGLTGAVRLGFRGTGASLGVFGPSNAQRRPRSWYGAPA